MANEGSDVAATNGQRNQVGLLQSFDISLAGFINVTIEQIALDSGSVVRIGLNVTTQDIQQVLGTDSTLSKLPKDSFIGAAEQLFSQQNGSSTFNDLAGTILVTINIAVQTETGDIGVTQGNVVRTLSGNIFGAGGCSSQSNEVEIQRIDSSLCLFYFLGSMGIQRLPKLHCWTSSAFQ